MIIKIVNDGEEEITLPDQSVVAPGAEVEVSAEKVDAILAVIYPEEKPEEKEEEATEPEAETEKEPEAEEKPAEETQSEEEQVANDETVVTAEATLAEERKALAEERAKLAEEKAELHFAKLCEAGKVVPAQKEAYMALAGRGMTVAEGNLRSVAELLDDFIQSAPVHCLMEEEGQDETTESEPELTAEEKQVAEAFGNTDEELINYKKGI